MHFMNFYITLRVHRLDKTESGKPDIIHELIYRHIWVIAFYHIKRGRQIQIYRQIIQLTLLQFEVERLNLI